MTVEITPAPIVGEGIPSSARMMELYAVASQLFAELGYASTSMKDIARAVGIQASSIYNYVDSKQKILDTLVLSCIQGSHDLVIDALASTDDPAEQVLAAMRSQVHFRLHHANDVLTASREMLHLSPDIREQFIALRDETREAWRDVVARGVELGAFQVSSPDLVSHMLSEMCSYIQVKYYWIDHRTPEEDLIAWYCESALQMLNVRQR